MCCCDVMAQSGFRCCLGRMAIAIRDTDPIQGEQAEELFEFFYGEVRTTGKVRMDQLDATLSPKALEAIRSINASSL